MKRYGFIFFICSTLVFSLRAQNNSPWTIEASEIDPNHYFGVTLANGVVGIVSSPEPLKISDVVLNGVYDYYQRGRVSNILKTFNHLNLQLDIDGNRIGLGSIQGYKQVLDMRRAQLTTSFSVGNKAEIESVILSLRHLPYTSLMMVTIHAFEDITITPMSVIEAPNHLTDVRNYFAEIDRPHVKIPLLSSKGNSPTGRVTLAASNSFIFEEVHGKEPTLIHEDWDYNMHLAKFHKTLKAGETYTFAIVGSTCSSAQYKDPFNEAERLTIYAKLEGVERLLERHRSEWENLWTGDIEIVGDEQLTKDARFMLYHLYSFAREGTAYSISPMGLSGLGYNGHIFWDTELWMFPPLLMLQPSLAKSLLEYRFQRLEAARQNAFSHGFKGAMFPWESAEEGSEDTPVWALTGPFQHHITACVGWAFWKYFQATQDVDWLRERGWPVLKEVADFWASRVEREGPGQYNISNVIGANEWAENIDNNAFTNGIVVLVLRYATQAAAVLGLKADPDWVHVSDNIPILESKEGVTLENATYQGEIIKQADVNLLSYPLEFFQEREKVKRDLVYYYPKLAPDGPAMGFSIASVLFAQLGDAEKALEIYKNSYQLNRVPPFGVLSETAGGSNPYFATGAGGSLQALLSGFGGLRFTDQGIQKAHHAPLPSSWQRLIIKGVGINKDTFEITR
jgi:protein-glucosylgalactosylhydroxylysine glucosidase